jgi:hypothetical protein
MVFFINGKPSHNVKMKFSVDALNNFFHVELTEEESTARFFVCVKIDLFYVVVLRVKQKQLFFYLTMKVLISFFILHPPHLPPACTSCCERLNSLQ